MELWFVLRAGHFVVTRYAAMRGRWSGGNYNIIQWSQCVTHNTQSLKDSHLSSNTNNTELRKFIKDPSWIIHLNIEYFFYCLNHSIWNNVLMRRQ